MRGPAFLLPFGCRHWLLGHPVPARELGLRYLRLTGLPMARRTLTGFPRSARVRHGWGRASSVPRGRRCPPGRGLFPGRRLPLHNGQPLSTRSVNPSRDVDLTRHQQGFTGSHPTPAFPAPVAPGRNRRPWVLPRAPHPVITDHARHGGDGLEHQTVVTSPASPDLLRRAHSPRATSCRTTP